MYLYFIFCRDKRDHQRLGINHDEHAPDEVAVLNSVQQTQVVNVPHLDCTIMTSACCNAPTI